MLAVSKHSPYTIFCYGGIFPVLPAKMFRFNSHVQLLVERISIVMGPMGELWLQGPVYRRTLGILNPNHGVVGHEFVT